MKLTFKEKAKLFWDRNKAMILGLVAMVGGVTVIGAVGVHYTKKAEKEHQEELEAQRAKLEEEQKAAAKEAEQREEELRNNPENQIAGGYVDPSNDNLTDDKYPNILVNTVPVANIGELGQEVVQRLNEEWFGEFGETYVENLFDPATATVDVYIDFGHEVWKRNHADESQEKQSA